MSAELQENSASKKLTPWQRLTRLQHWAGNAEMPLMMRLGRTNHLVSHALEQALKINSSHLRILFAALDPEGVTQSSLPKLYKIDPAAITRTIQAMERDGLLYRAPDARDNRCMRIFVTEKGKTLAHTMPGKIAAFEAMLTEGWPEEEIALMHRLLGHLEDRLNIDHAGLDKKEEESGILNESQTN
jgi:DNA-binding MarR family transcriptional regulator